ncbi:MAG: hypothetical protein AAFY41_11270 [Bacteroidota bacterium]
MKIALAKSIELEMHLLRHDNIMPSGASAPNCPSLLLGWVIVMLSHKLDMVVIILASSDLLESGHYVMTGTTMVDIHCVKKNLRTSNGAS